MTTGVDEPDWTADATADGWWFGENTAVAGGKAHATEPAPTSSTVPGPVVKASPALETPLALEAPRMPGASKTAVAAARPDPDQGLASQDGSEPAVPARSPGRLVLGLAVLAGERLRAATPGDGFLTGVGLLQQGATEARKVARRAMKPPARFASRAAGWASELPGAEAPARSVNRSKQRVGRIMLAARQRGAATVAAGRADAAALVQATVADGMAWAQAQAVPQIVDGLVPHLVDEVMPRIIDGVLPEIRARILPVVIEDLTVDPQIRDLVREQGRGIVGEAAAHVRSTTATADDRIESAFRRLVRSPRPEEADDEGHGHRREGDGGQDLAGPSTADITNR